MKLISVHSPKAGGTSISSALAEVFGSSFATDYSEDPANPLSPRNIDPSRYFSRRRKLSDGINCLHGHFHPGQFDLNDTFLFTILREPVDNIISIYFFWKTLPSQGQPLHDYFLKEELDIFEMASLSLLRQLYSNTYFGSFDMSRFDLIGCHDDRACALSELASRTGIPVDSSVRVNVTTESVEREEFVADAAQIQKLRSILEEDIRFYERYCG